MSVVRTPPQLSRIFRFGEFEFSVRAGELHRNGEVVRLQYQPLRVLLVLLEYSGEVVTREEIRQRVWPDESLQDFDNSLRVAVAKLRSAFNDDADNPRYIETLPRRGYRWLYPVTVHDNQRSFVEPNATETASPEGVGPQGLTPTTSTATISLKPSRRWILVKSIFVSVALWLAVSAAVWYLHPQSDTSDPSVRPLTTYPGLEYMPALSPDGKRVAFAWTGPNASDPYVVYVKQIGEDRAQRVTDTPPGAGDSDPVWMPDGGSILFFRRFGQDSGIYLVSTSGGNARQLQAMSLHGCPVRRARFDISPDGKTVVYPDRMNGQPQIALFLLDLESMKSHQLTFPPPESEGDRDPVFSHDGKVIAFDRDMLDSRQVYVVRVAGRDVRLLTDHNRADIDGLTWTHDDHQILLGGQQLRRISAS